MIFNSLVTEFFEGSNTEELMQRENPRMPESGFTLNQIMRLHIKFHKLALRQGSSYSELPKWIALKKAVINTKNNEEQRFNWAVIATLHHERIAKDFF